VISEQANRKVATPGSKLMTPQSWSVFAAILGGGVAIAGFAYWAPGSRFEPPRDYAPSDGYHAPPPPPYRPRR
jgi:hypothetical protein